jgi:hypothetical protein
MLRTSAGVVMSSPPVDSEIRKSRVARRYDARRF